MVTWATFPMPRTFPRSWMEPSSSTVFSSLSWLRLSYSVTSNPLME